MAMMTAALKDGEPTSEINTTPLIDVMRPFLVVLLTAMAPQAFASKADTPIPVLVQQTKTVAPIRLIVDFDGTYYWNGLRISWPEVERRLSIEAQRDVQPEIRIEPHRQAAYHYVGAAIEAARQLGLQKVSVIGGSK